MKAPYEAVQSVGHGIGVCLRARDSPPKPEYRRVNATDRELKDLDLLNQFRHGKWKVDKFFETKKALSVHLNLPATLFDGLQNSNSINSYPSITFTFRSKLSIILLCVQYISERNSTCSRTQNRGI